MSGTELDIAKSIRALEWLKTETVSILARLFKALLKGNRESAVENLALLVINCFLLLKRLGLNYGQMELSVYDKTEALLKEGHPLEEWYGDLSSFKAYLDLKR
ncbi:MAG: MazG-like family protein [Peptococcaceae bacterium]|jgi:hypothetical protein|nr:MazG-like family protein [Peptococcaceae bacterium]MDH7523784.1 MazG-like family protein [Peptococcaceae bacterium]